MIPDARLQELIGEKNQGRARRWTREHQYTEGWAIVDGCLVIYDVDDSPAWLAERLNTRDEDGNTSAFYNEAERGAVA